MIYITQGPGEYGDPCSVPKYVSEAELYKLISECYETLELASVDSGTAVEGQ